MQTASLFGDGWGALVGVLPKDLDLDALALATGALVRRRGVPNASALLRLALMRGPGGLSLRATASWAALNGVARLTDPSLNDRLHGAEGFLEAILTRLLADKGARPRGRWPGRCVRVADGSCISEPGSTGTDWRLHAVYDLERAGFSHVELTDGRGGEALDRGTPIAGEIRIADRGYGQAKTLRRFMTTGHDGGDVDYVVRLRWSALRLIGVDGRPFAIIPHLRALPAGLITSDTLVRIDDGSQQPAMPARLIVARKPPEAAEAERKRLRQAASRKQKRLDERSLIAAEFMMLATSLPEDAYPAEEVLAMYRLRWQIELAFKRLKSILHIDQLPCHTPQGVRSWLYAHLILAVVIDDLSQDFLGSSPCGAA